MSDPSPVEAIFAAMLERTDSAERARFLDEACSGNPKLRAEVERLLAAHENAGRFLEPPAATHDYASIGSASGHSQGTVVAGRYKLLQQIGEGGMGSVWMADQTEPIKRRVAVKLIRVERGQSKTILSRFEAERQAIALMDHPNIAKLLDAGTTESGAPYFVMELIKGVPLTEFCDAQRLSVPDRLQLFVQVCSAVQHAHQKGVIHRDLKPTNILVENHDGRPVPKVIDFGLAKATTGLQLTDNTLFTAFGSVMGTPLYMAPEQANFSAVDVDTRADLYALGVILYELLTGGTPLTKETIKQAQFDEVLRLIREQEPPTPSSRLSTSDGKPSIAASRQTEPAKLGNFVRGELDWIVMKALSKERDRRYETANGFARDVERFLNHEPVQAGPPSTSYRFKKFVQRNRIQVVGACLVLMTLLAGIVGTSWGLMRAEHRRMEAEAATDREAVQRGNAEAAKVEAQAKEAEANAVVKFFEDRVFAAARPKGQDGGLGAGVTLRDAIAASEPALDEGFPKQPLVEARLRLALGSTFGYLAEYDQARIQCERARAIYTQKLGPDHPATLSSMHNLAVSYEALNRLAEALKLREEVLEIRKRVLPKDHPDTLKGMHNLSNSYYVLNRHAEALKLREEVQAIQKRVLPKDHPDTLNSMNSLAASYAVLNRPAEALKLFEELLETQKRVMPKDHPETLTSMYNLALVYLRMDRTAEASKLFEEVLETQKRVLPKDHPDTLWTMNNLATCYSGLNRLAEALKLRVELLETQKRVLPKDHPDTLNSMNNLAVSYRALNRRAEALKLREELLETQKRVLPKDHPDTLKGMCNLAESLSQLGRGGEAIPLIDECVAKAAGQEVHPGMIPSVMILRMEHFEKVGDAAGCRATAAIWEKLNRLDAESLYHAGCFRSVTAEVQAKTPGAGAARLAKEDADRAMAWLTKAVAAGWNETAHMKIDATLNFLRDREDFKKLMAELEAKYSPKREVGLPSGKK